MSLREGNMRITHKGLRSTSLASFMSSVLTERPRCLSQASLRWQRADDGRIFYEIEVDGEKKEESVVMDKNATVAEFLKRFGVKKYSK